jgi:ribose 5-phosphate isomerase B
MLTENEIKDVVRKVVEQHLTAGREPASPPPPAPRDRTLALGADHGGYELKERLKPQLYELGWAVEDCGTHSDAPVDYPTVALAVALKVSEGRAACGIMIDGAGIGSCMAANKVPGIRAALCYDTVTARNSREHNDANVLTLGGRLIGVALAQEIVRTWLATECREERHRKRVALITDIERRFAGAGAPS